MREHIESLPDAVMMIAENGDIIAANSLMQGLLGFSSEELLAKKAEHLAPEELQSDYAAWRVRFFEVTEEEELSRVSHVQDTRALSKDGSEIALDISLKRFDSEETGPCLIASFREAASKQGNAASTENEFRDPLKEIADQARFVESVKLAVANAQAEGRFVAVLTIDTGQHRKIIDTLGRDAGDDYLREMVTRISRISRRQDTMARLAGDEFAVLIQSLSDPDVANKLAVRIQSFLSAPIYIGEHSFAPRPDIGVSVFPTDAQDAAALLRNADLAVRNARKAINGGISFFSEEMGERARQRLTLESDLRSAIFKDEFVVHFQPFFKLDSGDLFGVESFLRWQHPKLGTIELRDFMHIAEETGMAAPLGETALWLTFEAIRKWKAMGHWPLRVVHSLSPRQLARPDSLVRQLRGLLLDSKIDPQHVQFAIHETDMPMAEDQITALLEISEMGFLVCIDEFGIGASALTYLFDMPVHTIKFAPGLLAESIDDEHNQSVLAATVQMARELNIEVIGGDIESDAHLGAATKIGCDAVQGDWRCPSLNFEKLCNAVFTGDRTNQTKAAPIDSNTQEKSLSETQS
ncbi:MAG: EAL domain-containing protein [Betaproteobacteria bacterium]|nr:MAG: EAL domain-containing protein [Betaproteobacteria bacterium]